MAVGKLEEALTHGPDPLHLAVVFDLDPKTAIRYADSARQLLQTCTSSRSSSCRRCGHCDSCDSSRC